MSARMSSDRLERLDGFWEYLVSILIVISFGGGLTLTFYVGNWASIWIVCGSILTFISIYKAPNYARIAGMADLRRAQAKSWIIVDPEMT